MKITIVAISTGLNLDFAGSLNRRPKQDSNLRPTA